MKTVYLVSVDYWYGSISDGTYQEYQKSAIVATEELARKWLALNDPAGNGVTTEYVIIDSEDRLV